MGKFFEYANKTNKKEDDKKITSSTSPSLGNFGKYAVSKTIGLNTLSSDLDTLSKSVSNAYSGWQSRETMQHTLSSMQSMYDRLGKYQEYSKTYGGTDLTELRDTYKGIIDDWDSLSRKYSGYDNAEAYNKAVSDSKALYEKQSSVDLGALQTEIEGLEDILKNVEAHQGNIRGLETKRNTWEHRSNGLKTDMGYGSKVTEAQTELDKYLKSVGYDSVDALKKDLGDKKVFKTQAERLQNLNSLSSVGDKTSKNYDKDFEKYVASGQSIPTDEVGTSKRRKPVGHGRTANTPKVNDDLREVALAFERRHNGQTSSNSDSYYDRGAIFDLMTDEEFNNFYYYLGKDKEDGGNKAQEYVDAIAESLNSRRGEQIAKLVEDKPWGELGFSIEAGLDQWSSGMKANFSDKDYIPSSPVQHASGIVRENVGEDYGKFWGTMYDLGVTGANQLPSILVSTALGSITGGVGGVAGKVLSGVSKGAGLATMGISARGNAYQEMLSLGYDKDQASTYANLVAVSETGLQALLGGIGKLGGTSGKIAKLVEGIDNGFARFAIQWGGSVASEATEEGLQEILNPLFQNIAAGYDTGAEVDWSEVAYSALLGGLMGGMFEGPGLATNSIAEHSHNKALGKDIKANDRVADVFDIASNPEVASAYDTYTRYANKGVTTENISDVQLGRLYNKAKTETVETLNSKKSTTEQKENALKRLAEMSIVETENVVAKEKKNLNIGEETTVTESGETVDIKDLKVKGEDIVVSTEKGEISVDDMTIKDKDADLVALARIIAREDGEDVANLFISQYDGEADVNAYANSFNLAKEYAKHNFPQETILENKGVLSAPQVNAIYQATVINEANARETELKNLAEKQGKTMTIQGVFDDSIIDYNSSTTDDSKVNWNSLTTTQRAAIKFTKLFSKATRVNIKFIKSNVKDGKHQGKNGSYDPTTNTIEIDVYAGRIDAASIKDSIIPTLSHEITHWMKAKSPSVYNSIKEDIIKTLKQGTGQSSEIIINKELNRLNKNHPEKKHTVDEAIDEIVARACEDMLSNSNAARKLLNKMSKSEQQSFIAKVKETFENLMQWVNDLLAHYKSTSEEAKVLREYKYMLKKISKQWDEMLANSIETNQALENGAFEHKKTTSEGGVRYALREEAISEVEQAITNKSYDKEIKLTDSSPAILTSQKGVKNLPMMIKASHARENILTEEEAKKLGLSVRSDTHFHGLGKTLFLEVIDGLDGVTRAYRGTKNAEKSERRENYFLLVSQHKDAEGNVINVPVYINEGGIYNRVYINTNKIATVFGRNEFETYIKSELAKGNLVRIKNRSTQASESSPPIGDNYSKNASNSSIRNSERNVNTNFSERDAEYLELAKNPEKNEARLRELVDEVAKKAGYTDDVSWRMAHQAPDSRYDEPFYSLDKVYGYEIYTEKDSRKLAYYFGDGAEFDQKAISVIQKAAKNPDALVTVYRAVPTNIKDTRVRNGDWVTIVKEYAEEHGYRNLDNDYRIIENKVPAKYLWANGDSIHEYGYDNGNKNEVYKNAVGNVKLAVVTYDDNGNVIPLSQRFNPEKKDIRYSDRDDTTVYDLMGETERVVKENEKFKAEIERLKERLAIERKVTKGNYFNENQLGAVAGHLRNISKSNIDKIQLMKALKDVYSHIAHSENLAWEDVFERCYRIAESMIAEAKPLTISDDYSKALLKEIRGTRISLDETQKQEAKSRFGKNWNNHFMGKVVIANDGINIDTKWQEWSREHPDVFDADINSNDMISELYDIIDSLKESSEVIDTYSMEEQTRWLANEIYNQYWNVSPIRTTADKYDKRIKELNFEHRRAMTELRDDYNTRLKEQHKVDREKQKKLVSEIRERKDKEIALAKQHGREMMSKYKENAERKTAIQRVTANALSLNEMLVKNSKDKHIPEIMKGPVTSLLQAIDFSSKRMLERSEPTRKDISLSKSLSKVKDMMVKATNAHEELVELYGHGLDEDIEKMVDSVDDIMRTVGDNEFVLNKMSLADLQTLDKMVKTIKHAVNKLNKFHTVNHAKGIANLSQESIVYLDSLGKGKVYDGLRGKSSKLLNWGNALPYYVFKRYGSGGIKIYEALQNGWDKFAFNTKAIMDYANDSYTSKEVNEWSEEVKTFKILIPATEEALADENYQPQYQEVQLTVPQIMSLYCLNKREQARGHLFKGGIRVADFKTKKGEIVSQSEGVIFTEKDIAKILNSLTDRQKSVADKLQRFMNDVCADWGNDVSMARFGYKAFGEPNYFPIQSDKNNLAVNDETEQVNSLFKLLNMSFTKATEEKANNRIVISDIFDVFAQHTSDMAKYNALALPVLDAFKWYNYTEKQDIAEGTFKTSGVKQSIESAFGKDGQSYFTTFLKDINGQQEVSRDTLGNGFFKNAKIAAVGANLRVVLLQPTSYVRASAVIDNKYLSKALIHKPKIAKAETHCGIALWKSMGYYDTNIQKGLEAQIKHADTWKDKVTDWSMKGAEIADKITWGYLWNACELEIRDTRNDLKVGSQEFYDAIAKRLREVIYATQVVDSTMTRSQMMRSSDGRDKLLTAFASEPTLSYNMLQDAYFGYQLDARRFGKGEAIKKHRKRIARVLTAYTMTNAVAALVESAFDALRDDDDEEMDMIKFMKLYFSNFASDMSITAKIPYVKEFHSFIQGFSSSRTDTQWMENITKAMTYAYKLSQGKGKPITGIKYSLKALSDLFGIPFYNVYRDSMATLNKLDLFTAEDLNEMFGDFLD